MNIFKDRVCWPRLSNDLFEWHISRRARTTSLCALFDLDPADFVLSDHNNVSVHLSLHHSLSQWGNVAFVLLVTHFCKHFPERTPWTVPDLGRLSPSRRHRENGSPHSACHPRIGHHQLSNHCFCQCGNHSFYAKKPQNFDNFDLPFLEHIPLDPTHNCDADHVSRILHRYNWLLSENSSID